MLATKPKTTIYAQLRKATLPSIVSYRDDLLVHDKRWLRENPGVPFVHCAGENGTHLIPLPAADTYPAAGEYVPYLFATANRTHILEQKAVALETIRKSGMHPVVHWYNGRELKQVAYPMAADIIATYRRRIEREWREARERS